MRLNFKFKNLVGTVYRQGNILFEPDGDTLVSPVGNKVTLFNLKRSVSETLPVETKLNIVCVAMDPRGVALIMVDERGDCHYVSLISQTVLHRHSFKKTVRAVQFSPDGRHIGVCRDTNVHIYQNPGASSLNFGSFCLEDTFFVAHETNTCLDWSYNSRFFVVGSDDMQVRVCGTTDSGRKIIFPFSGHCSSIVACFFEADSYDMYAIDASGFMIVWKCNVQLDTFGRPSGEWGEESCSAPGAEAEAKMEDGAEKRHWKSYFTKHAKLTFADGVQQKGVKLTSAFYHKKRRLLVTGHSNGSFLLHEMPDFNLIHSLNISGYAIDSVAVNATGDWIGIASAELGQLVVWEWQSETFAMKQQGHFNKMTCLAYSPNGTVIATGGYDSKVKLWNVQDGTCFATFNEHTGAITGIAWTQGGKAVLSCSHDGTVRAFDLKRYRNFRTFVTPEPVQLSSIAVDVTGDLVCAAGQDTFDIFLWSVQTGRLLEVISGHEAPVSDVCFCPTESALASCSWDKTARIWDIAEGKSRRDIIQLSAEALSLKFSPDGALLACCSLDCVIAIFDWRNNVQMYTIEGKFDLDPKRSDTDVITAAKSALSKSFTSIAFSFDGECLLAGGQSPFLCIYSVEQQLLLKKFKVTCNRSLNAVDDDVDMRKMSEFGNIELIDTSDEDELTHKNVIQLPGVKKEDIGRRSARPEVRIYSVQFSPTGTALAACTTEGLLIYSSDSRSLFEPYMLGSEVTPKAVCSALDRQSFTDALIMTLSLNLPEVTTMTVERIPATEIDSICRVLPEAYVERLLRFFGDAFLRTAHVEFYLLWIRSLCVHHVDSLRSNLKQSLAAIITVLQALNQRQTQLSRICDSNKYTLRYLISVEQRLKPKEGDVPNDEDHLMEVSPGVGVS